MRDISNKNYVRGYKTELKARDLLKKAGYYVSRMAGSHGLFDIIAINKKEVRLIQIKRTKKNINVLNLEDYGKIQRFSNCPPNAIKEIWVWIDGYGFITRRVEDE